MRMINQCGGLSLNQIISKQQLEDFYLDFHYTEVQKN